MRHTDDVLLAFRRKDNFPDEKTIGFPSFKGMNSAQIVLIAVGRASGLNPPVLNEEDLARRCLDEEVWKAQNSLPPTRPQKKATISNPLGINASSLLALA